MRFFSALMAIVLAIGLMPLPAFAATEAPQGDLSPALPAQGDTASDSSGDEGVNNSSSDAGKQGERANGAKSSLRGEQDGGHLCNSTSVPAGIPTQNDKGQDVVYMSISSDGAYVTSDGENSGVTMANVAIPISEVAKIKLSDYGLEDYTYQVDGTDQVTVLHLYLYVLKNYYSGGTDSFVASGAAGSLYITSFWGLDPGENFTYYANGEYPLQYSGWGATADQMILRPGIHVDLTHFTDMSFWMDSNAGHGYFYDTSKSASREAITLAYSGNAGEAISLGVLRAGAKMSTGNDSDYGTGYYTAAGQDVYYATSYKANNATKLGTTDENGKVSATITEPGTYYVWTDGQKGSDNPDVVVSGPAMATITVKDSNAAPALAEGVSATAEASVAAGEAYTLDLSTIFSDANNDELTYKVAINDAEAVAADASYSYTPEGPGTTTLKFTANDGKVDSTDTYTVTLTATYEVITEGTTTEFVAGSGSPVVFKSSAPAEKFDNFVFDGNTLTKDTDYTVTSGSTIITLSNDFAATLTPGEHTWAMNYTDGAQVTGTLDVKEGTDPTDLWNSSRDGNGWIGQNAMFALMELVQVSGLEVKSYTWDGNTCDVVFVSSTKKESPFTLNIRRSGTTSGGVKINGTNNTSTSLIAHPVELSEGTATVTLQPYWSSRTGTLKTFNFSIEGGGQETTWNVSLPTGAGYTVTPVGESASPVAHKGSFTFKVELTEGYKKGADFVVKVDGEAVELDENGQYTISNIKGDKVVTVEDVVTSDTVNQYRVTLPEVPGATIAASEGSSSPVDEGGSFSFTLVLDEDSVEASNFAVTANGATLTPSEEGVYTISDIHTHQAVSVAGVVRLATITAPANSTITVGYQSGYFKKIWIDPARTATLEDGRVKYSYAAVSNAQLFYRVQNPEGVTYWKYLTALNEGDRIEVTPEQLFIGDSSFTKASRRGGDGNIADVYMPINPAGYVNVATGAESTMNFFRNWLPVDSTISNDKEGIPDFHYEAVDVDGNPSDLVSFTPDKYNPGVVTMKASSEKTGMAIVKVTYDAMYIDGRTTYGPQFGAIWPERTGVFVVTVGQDGTGIETNMQISQIGAADRVIDAEHDTLYYEGDEGATYSFTPEAGTTVTVARPTLTETSLAYNGFTNEGVSVDANGQVTITGLMKGRNIVKIAKGDVATYQVLTASDATYVLQTGGETVGTDHVFAPGDQVAITYSGLVSPSEKFSGKYNFNFRVGVVGQDGTSASEASPGSYGVYNFTTKDHGLTFTIPSPEKLDGHTYTLNGAIIKAGFAGGDGTHRTSTYGAGGGMAWGTEGTGATTYSALPDITLTVDSKPYVMDDVVNPATASAAVNETYAIDLGKVFADADGDALSYSVSINGADPVDAVEYFWTSFDEAGTYNLEFSANDGIFDSDGTYQVTLKVGQENTAPTLKEGVEATAEATIAKGSTYELNLGDIFEDVDGDNLAYKVAVNGAAAVDAPANYTYTPDTSGTKELVFTANDGTVDSTDTFTVTITVPFNTDSPLYWNNATDGNGWVGNSSTYCYMQTVGTSGVSVAGYEWTDATTCNIVLAKTTETDATFDFVVTNYARTASYGGVLINGVNYSGSTRTVPISLVEGKASVTVQPWGYRSDRLGTLKTFNFSIGKNKAPALAEGVEAEVSETLVLGESYTPNFTQIFADADGDALTYKVAVDGADAVAAETGYSFTPTAAGKSTLVFMANDGEADSAAYTVTLTTRAQNEVPALAEGVSATAKVAVFEGEAFELDLTQIFADADDDALTYAVAVNGAKPTAADAAYSMTPKGNVTYTLVFTANDGRADSTDSYTVTLSVALGVHETVADATAGSEYEGALVITGYVNPDDVTVYTVDGFDVPGLELAENGAITGTPTTAGTYTFKVLVMTDDRVSKITEVTLEVLDVPTITTESLPAAMVGQEYEATIEATGYSEDGYTFALADGSTLPAGLALAEDGKISGTAPEAAGKATFTVEAIASDGQKASKELTISVKTKYRQATGTVYLTVSDAGDWVVSDGVESGTKLCYVPIDLAKVAKYDLDAYGMGQYNYTARKADGSGFEADPDEADYVYEVTCFQLWLYALDQFYLGGAESLQVSGGAGSTYLTNFFGHDSNLNYYYNGGYPIDWEMTEQWNAGYNVGATADHVALKDGDFVDVSMFSMPDDGWKYSADFRYFVDLQDVQHVVHSYGEQATGESFQVYVRRPNSNYWSPGSTQTYSNVPGITVEWGKKIDEPIGSVVADGEGKANITIYEPGEYKVWAKQVNEDMTIQALPAYATVTIAGEAQPVKPILVTKALSGADLGAPYEAAIEATGYPSDFTFSAKAGSLPEGLVLNADGTITGTPTEAGKFEVPVVVTNEAGSTKATYELIVYGPITLDQGIPDKPIQLVAGQSAEYEFSVSGTPQDELGVDQAFGGWGVNDVEMTSATSGKISGTPQERAIGRTFNFYVFAGYKEVYVEDGEEYETYNHDFTRFDIPVTIVGEPAITTDSIEGVHWSRTGDTGITLQGTGGGLAWSVVEGALPSGITLDADTGELKGHTTRTGAYSVTVQAANAAGTAQKTYNFTVVDNPNIVTDELPVAVVDSEYSAALVAETFDAAPPASEGSFSISSGSLPAGLALASDGTISGTPEATGTSSFTVRFQAGTYSTTKKLTLTVEEPLAITTESVPAIFVGQSDYSFQFEAVGIGSDNLTWSVETSSVGNQYLNLSESGLLTSKSARTGTASIAPNYFKVTATAADGTSVTKGFRVAWKNKYQPVSGTHYVSFSVDGAFAISDGATAGTTLWHAPITATELRSADLDAAGLGQYKSAAPSDANDVPATSSANTQSWVYPINALNLLVAANNKYSADPEVQVGASWIKKAFGKTGSDQFTFLVNGVYPMQEGSTTTGAMINEVPVTSSTSLDLAYFTDPNFSTDFNNGQKTFVDDSGKVLYNKTGVFAGDETALQLQLTGIDWTVGGGTAGTAWPAPDFVSKSGIAVAYGKAYGTPEGTVETDDNGIATITFPETEDATSAVTWYVWAAGNIGVMAEMMDEETIVNSPAMVTVAVTNKAAAEITTASIANQRINSPMNVSLAASGQPKTFTWSLGEGSTLPQGVELTEAGKLTGTPTEKGEFTFTAIASNGVGDPASKEFTFTVGDKYKQLEGTAYLTLCYLDKFEMSTANGTEKTAGVPIAHLPIDLADASQWDAEAHGLPSGANGSVNDEGSYDLTAVRLIGYAAEKYYDAENPAAAIQGTSYVTGAWGHDTGNIIYEVSGVSPMVGIGDWKVQDGEVVCLYNCTNWNAWGDPYYGFHYFLSEANTTGFDKDKITYRYEGEVNKPVEVYFSREAGGVMSSSDANDAAGYTLYYGRSYNDAAGFVTCDENGTAQITFDEPGEWVIWADGGKGQRVDDFVSSAAIAWASISGTPVVKTIELPDATAMTEYNAQLEAYGGDENTTWFVEDSSKLPAGISVAQDGTVSGMATTPDAYEFTVYAMSEAGVSEAATVKITVVGEAPAITTAELAEAAVGTEYSAAIETTGTPAPAITVEGLPEGLAFNAETGAIEGMPTQGGEFNVVVKASNGLAPDAEATLKLVVKADPVFVTESLPAGFVDVDYEAQIEVTAYPQPTLLVTGLPAGLSFDKETGKITGVPTEEGSSAVKVIAVGGTKNVSMEYLLTITSVDDTLFNNAKDAAEQKIEEAGTALEAAKTAAESAQAAAQAVDAAADPAAKAQAAQASVEAAQAAVDKAAEAADAADQALAAAQAAQTAAVTNTQKATAEELVSQAQAAKTAADEAKTAANAAANAAKTAADEAKAVADAAKAVADADKTVAETGSAAEAAKAAADAVNAATDPAAKAEAAQAAVEAAQAAVDKAAAAVEAAQAAVEAAQSAKDAATSDEQKAAAEALLVQAQAAMDAANAAKAAADEGKIAADAAKAAADAAKAAADKASKVEAGKTYQVGGMSYKVTKVASDNANGAVTLTKAKNAKSVVVPDAVKLADGKSYAVDTIATKAFSKLKKLKKATVGANIKKIEKSAFFKTPKLKKLVVKSNQLKKKASVKGALKGSKAKKLKVKVPKKLKKAYKKSFKKSNLKAPKKVTVK